MELKQAFIMRDGDIQADIVNYIIKTVAPALGENTSSRADLRKGIETIFYNANKNLPEDVRIGWGAEGEAFLKAHGDQLDLNP